MRGTAHSVLGISVSLWRNFVDKELLIALRDISGSPRTHSSVLHSIAAGITRTVYLIARAIELKVRKVQNTAVSGFGASTEFRPL